MGNVETHDLAPVRDDERKELNLARKITYRQYKKGTYMYNVANQDFTAVQDYKRKKLNLARKITYRGYKTVYIMWWPVTWLPSESMNRKNWNWLARFTYRQYKKVNRMVTVLKSFTAIDADKLQLVASLSRCFIISVHLSVTYFLCPVSTVANVENNEKPTENNNVSGHILLPLFSIRLTHMSHYSTFSSIHKADANVLNCLKPSHLPCKWRRMQNNVTRECDEWRIMQGECDLSSEVLISIVT